MPVPFSHRPLRPTRRADRKAAVMVLGAFLMVAMVAMIAFGVDIGRLLVARSQLQNSADSAAMAAAWKLLDNRRLVDESQVSLEARLVASQYAFSNEVMNLNPAVQLNPANNPQGDIVFGRLDSNGNMNAFGNPRMHNAALVRVKRTADQNGELAMFFASVLGVDAASVSARAIATFRDGIVGFRPTSSTGNTSLIPFTVHISDWNQLVNGNGPDDWTYNPDTQQVEPGADGIPEMQMFNGDKDAPGNFGTLEIGPPSYGNAEIQRQTREGVSQADLDYYGGELKLDPTSGTLELEGDTGFTTNNGRAAEDIIGKPVTLPIHQSVSGGGNNTSYTIVGFGGVRVVYVNTDGEIGEKHILVQPAIVVDASAISGGNATSDNVYQPVVLAE